MERELLSPRIEQELTRKKAQVNRALRNSTAVADYLENPEAGLQGLVETFGEQQALLITKKINNFAVKGVAPLPEDIESRSIKERMELYAQRIEGLKEAASLSSEVRKRLTERIGDNLEGLVQKRAAVDTAEVTLSPFKVVEQNSSLDPELYQASVAGFKDYLRGELKINIGIAPVEQEAVAPFSPELKEEEVKTEVKTEIVDEIAAVKEELSRSFEAGEINEKQYQALLKELSQDPQIDISEEVTGIEVGLLGPNNDYEKGIMISSNSLMGKLWFYLVERKDVSSSDLRIALYGEDNKRTAHNLENIISNLRTKIVGAGQRVVNTQSKPGNPAVYNLDYIQTGSA